MQRVETRRIASKQMHRRLAIETMRRARRCSLRCCRAFHRGLDDDLTPACRIRPSCRTAAWHLPPFSETGKPRHLIRIT